MRILQLHAGYRTPAGEDTVVHAEAEALRNAGHDVLQIIEHNPHGTAAALRALTKSRYNRATGAAVADGDIGAGEKKAAACIVCHDKEGLGTMPNFPNLGGQQALYLAEQIKAFRDGKRNDENMNIVVESLSDQDIEDLAAYYESLKAGCPE